MDKQEAEYIARVIRKAHDVDGLPFVVRDVHCTNYLTQRWEVKVGYLGETKRYRNSILEHGIAVYIKNPAHWARLKAIYAYGVPEQRR
jgi:hypothetical protein